MRYRGQSETIVSADAGSDEKNFNDEKNVQAQVNEELNGFEQAIESYAKPATHSRSTEESDADRSY